MNRDSLPTDTYNLPDEHPAQSLTRLLVGSVVIGMDVLLEQLQRWEDETNLVLQEQASRLDAYRSVSDEDLSWTPDQEGEPEAAARQPEPVSAVDAIRYTLVGGLFEVQRRISPPPIESFDQPLARMLHPLVMQFATNPTLAPLREQFQQMSERGEQEVARLLDHGRREEAHSRLLFLTAMRVTTETSIHEVVQNQEVRQLVQQQSAGLANEVVEEVREHTFSIDTVVERFVRRTLNMRPREEITPPPFANPRDPSYVGRPRKGRKRA